MIKLASLTDRLDAVCIKLGITKQVGIEQAIEKYVENFEYNEKVKLGCGGKHECYGCNNEFDCYEFCGQTMYHGCRTCQIKMAQGKLK